MESKEWVLTAESELRCEIKSNESLEVRLVQGSAELFGVELAVEKTYIFSDENIAFFSWHGCTLQTKGSCMALYLSEDRMPMLELVNVHQQLEARRDIAFHSKSKGPRVLLVGTQACGKSTAARILSMYAARLEHTPVLADIDVGRSTTATVPGCVSAIAVDETCLSIEENFDVATPLAYFYGHTNPAEEQHYSWYKHQINLLAKAIEEKQSLDPISRAAGIIVNSGPWSGDSKSEKDHICHVIEAFDIDIVLVIEHDRLFSTLNSWIKESAPSGVDSSNWRQGKDVKSDKVTLVKLRRSGGVVSQSDRTKIHLRRTKIHEYFYGKRGLAATDDKSSRYKPHRFDLSLSDCRFFSAGGERLSESMRPLGNDAAQLSGGKGGIVSIQPSAELEHALLAVLQPTVEDGADASGEDAPVDLLDRIADTNVAGFLHVVNINLDQQVMTVLSPCPGKLPSMNFLVGSVKWLEK